MRIKKYSWLAVLPMIFTACQEEMLVKEQQQDKVYTLTADMEDGVAMSRAQIQLGKTTSGEELFFWNENDEFDLYLNGDVEPKVFTITDYSEPYEGEKTTATFTTTSPVPIDEDYVAVYPSGVNMVDNSFEFNINNSLEFNSWSEQEYIWASYLQQNMYMMADGKFEDPDDASVSFNHLCALIRVSYSNESGVPQSINSLSISSETPYFSSSCRYSMDGTVSTNLETSYELWTNGLTVQSDGTTDFYVLFFPGQFSEGNDEYLEFMINKDDSNPSVKIDLSAIKEANPNDDGFKAGKRYWFKVTETEKGLTWTNYTKTVEVDDITSFRDAMESPTVTHIALKSPIVISSELDFESTSHKTIFPSEENFTWTVGGVEQDALIINESGSNIHIGNCTIQGSASETDGEKYLVKAASNTFYLVDATLDAAGTMNGAKVKDAEIYFSNTSVDLAKGRNAVAVWSENNLSNVYVEGNTIINGNVSCVSNYDGWSGFHLNNSTLDGEITVSGDYISKFAISMDENSVYTGSRSAEVSTWKELQDFVNNGVITNIILTNPIIVPESEENREFSSNKIISMSDNFEWTVDGTEYDALIINQAEVFDLNNCTLVGTTDLDSKYLLRSDAGTFRPSYVKLDANGAMNGMKLADVHVYMDGKSSVDVESGNGYALYITADNVESEVILSIEGEINGNIYFENNFDSEDDWSMLQIYFNCTLNGEVITAGDNIQDLRVHLYGEYNGAKKIEADDIQDIRNVVYNETVDTIVLKNPIVVTGEVGCIFSTNKDRAMRILMDERFDWFVNTVEYDALFVNDGGNFNLGNCNLKGSAVASTSEKYLLKTTAGSLFVYDSILDAGEEMNGVKVEGSWFSLMYETSVINVENSDKVALNIYSSADEVSVDVHIQGTVNGDVTYLGNNSSSNYSDSFHVSNTGKLYGDLTASYKYCRITYENGSVVEGNGWNSFVSN